MGRGTQPIPSRLHLHQHHLDGDDGVVDQKPQGDDERTQADPIQVDALDQHQQEGDREGQGDGDADDQTGAPADGDEADQHHHRDRDQELDLKEVDGMRDGVGLIGEMREADAQRQTGLKPFLDLDQALPERQAVLAALHHHAEQDYILPAGTDQKLGWILVTAADLGDLAQRQKMLADTQRHLTDILELTQLGVRTQIEPRPVGLDQTRRGKPILGIQGLAHRSGRYPEIGETRLIELHEKALRPLTQDARLLHPFDPGQPIADPLGLAHQQAVRQIRRRECIEREIDIREVVVHERSEHPGRQTPGRIRHAFAHLVEEIGDLLGGRVVLKLDQHVDPSGTRRGFQPVEELDLADALLQRIGDQILHLLRARARPERRDHHHPHGKGRVFRAAELQEGKQTGERGHQDEKERDRALAHGERGEIHPRPR